MVGEVGEVMTDEAAMRAPMQAETMGKRILECSWVVRRKEGSSPDDVGDGIETVHRCTFIYAQI